MINEAKEGLRDLLCYNDSMRRKQAREEDLQRQERAFIDDKQIRKSQKEAEEKNKQAEMDACINKEQQVPEYQQATKSAMEHAK